MQEDSQTAHPWGNLKGNCSYFYSPANPFCRWYAKLWVVESNMGKRWHLSPRQNLSLQLFGILQISSPLLKAQTKHIINIACISFASVPYQSSWRTWRICHVRPGAHAMADCHGCGAHSHAAQVVFPQRNTCSLCQFLLTYIWQLAVRSRPKADCTYGHISHIIPLAPIVTNDCGFVYFQLNYLGDSCWVLSAGNRQSWRYAPIRHSVFWRVCCWLQTSFNAILIAVLLFSTTLGSNPNTFWFSWRRSWINLSFLLTWSTSTVP